GGTEARGPAPCASDRGVCNSGRHDRHAERGRRRIRGGTRRRGLGSDERLVQRPQLVRRARSVGSAAGAVRSGARSGPPPRLIRRRYSDLTEYAETQQFCWRIRECRHFRMPTRRKTSPIPLSVTQPPLISPPMAILNPPRRIHRVLTAGLVPAAAAVLLLGGCGGAPAGTASVKESGEPAARTEAENRAASVKVPEATTYTTVRGAPKDPAPDGVTDGLVVNPSTALPVLDRPDGRRIATLPTRQLGNPTWVPVVETSGAWRRVLLPSRPNNATGWISGEGLRTARTPYTVRVDLGRRVLTLAKSGREVGRWRVAIGGAETPTPTGRTFL